MSIPREKPVLYSDAVPGREGRVLRAVCGVLLGLVLGLYLWVRARCGMAPGLALVAACTVGCAFGSARWGDAFWVAILRRP